MLAVFVSGTGRTLRNLIARCADGSLPARVGLVVASRECGAVEVARDAGVPVVVRAGDFRADELDAVLKGHGVGWVALAGYLRLLPIPEDYRGRIVNIHPALLPEFGGSGMHGLHVHRAVLASGAGRSGCSVHICDDRYDTGPIVVQRECAVLPGDTPESLAARVFALELEAYPEALRLLIESASAPQAAAGRGAGAAGGSR